MEDGERVGVYIYEAWSICPFVYYVSMYIHVCSASALLVFAKGVDRIRLPAEYVITEVREEGGWERERERKRGRMRGRLRGKEGRREREGGREVMRENTQD